jgi:surface carbohydrate biosynthesis protein
MRVPKRLSSKQNDVLIVDAEGADMIRHCIPDSLTASVLPVRKVIPWIMNLKFLLRVFIRVFRRENLGRSILYAIVDVINPKVLISNIDNGVSLGEWALDFPDKLVISVQNGFRSKAPHSGWKVGSKQPIFYGFGDCERDTMLGLGISSKEYIPVGSLRCGLYSEIHREVKRRYDFCFVSQFVARLNDVKGLMLQQEAHGKCFTMLVNFCRRHGYSLVVALRGSTKASHSELEEGYFQSLDKSHYALLKRDYRDEWSSYDLASSSEVVVGSTSTLVYEMFGLGKKTLFFGGCSKLLLEEWGSNGNFEKLPDCVRIDSLAKDPLENKFSVLLKMDQEDYLERAKSAQSHYMRFLEQYPHEIIKNRISEYVKRARLSSETF